MSKPRLYKRIMAAGVLAAAAVPPILLFGFGRTSPNNGSATSPETGARSLSDSGAPSRTGGPRPRSLEVGVRLAYDLDYGIRFGTDMEGSEGALNLVGTGQLSLTVIELTAERRVWAAQLSNASLISENESGKGRVQDGALRELAEPFRIVQDGFGRVKSLDVAPEVRGLSHNLIKLMACALQFVRSTDPAQKETWTADETDSYGTYRASYQRTAPRRYEKTKLEYLSYASDYPPTSPPKVESDVEITFGDNDFIERVAAREQASLKFGEAMFAGQNHLTLTLRHVERAQPPRLPADLRATSLDRSFSVSNKDRDREARRRSIEGVKFSSLMDELGAAANDDARQSVVERLATLVEFEPSAIADAVRALRDPQNRDRAGLLMGGLSSSESPEGLGALANLVEDGTLDSALRSDVATHLGLHPEPTREVVDALERLTVSDDQTLAQASTLALGGAVRRASAGEDEEARLLAADAAARLSQRANGATTPDERLLLIDALGNAGSPSGLATIKGALADPDPSVRRRAVAALRFIPGEEVDQLLITVIRSDPDPDVRSTAIGAVSDRTPSPLLVVALSDALRSEKDVAARREIVTALVGALPRQDAVQALEWAVQNDASQDIRVAADQALATVREG